MPLSDSEVRSLKPKEKVYRRSVGESLYIEVHPEKIKKDGSKGGGFTPSHLEEMVERVGIR